MNFKRLRFLALLFVATLIVALSLGLNLRLLKPAYYTKANAQSSFNNSSNAEQVETNTSSGDLPGTIKPPLQQNEQNNGLRAPDLLGGPRGVLFYCGNGGKCGEGLTQIHSYYHSLGAYPVAQRTHLPENLAEYRLLFVVVPTKRFSYEQVRKLKEFIESGGRLVLVGDYPNYWTATEVGNSLLSELNVPISFNTDEVDPLCNKWFTKNYGNHPLTSGLPTTGIEYAATSTLQLGSGAGQLLGTVTDNQPFLAVYPQQRTVGGDVIVAADSNLFIDSCSPPNQQLWNNLFTIVDDDGDGLLNDWELRGYSANNDGVIDVDLPALGAKSKRKDLFIEIDWMEGCAGNSPSKKPLPAAIDQIIHSFEIAPVNNPDKSTGIALHVDYGQGYPFNGGNAIACQNPLTWPSDFQPIKNANFDTRRQRIFHYNVWGVTYNGTTSSGISEITGDDFLVSLGSFTGGNGTQDQQAGTFMHEFGHNLGLRHGGTKDDNVNYKPNHLSVMNYTFQLTGVILNGQLGDFDYSRVSPPDLDELALDETKGLNGDDTVDPYGTMWFCQNLNNQGMMTTNANGPIDWNCDGTINTSNVATDINKDGLRNILKQPDVQWSSLVLADTNRPGIPSGDQVGPFDGTQIPNNTQQLEAPAAELMEIESQMRHLMQQQK